MGSYGNLVYAAGRDAVDWSKVDEFQRVIKTQDGTAVLESEGFLTRDRKFALRSTPSGTWEVYACRTGLLIGNAHSQEGAIAIIGLCYTDPFMRAFGEIESASEFSRYMGKLVRDKKRSARLSACRVAKLDKLN